MINLIKKAFPLTIPVLTGYMAIGIAFGVMLQERTGYGPVAAGLMSIFMFAGSGEYLCVGLMAANAPLIDVALLTFILHFRHFFYSISMLHKYQQTGWKKFYLYFGLTDENYALISGCEVPEGIKPENFYVAITLMNHVYWTLGSIIGAAIGKLIPFDMTGIDFAMTALFAVLAVEQWYSAKSHVPAILGAIVSILAVIIVGPDNFLIVALAVITAILLFARKQLESKFLEEL